MPLKTKSRFVTVGSRNNPNDTGLILYGDATTRAQVLADWDTAPGSFPAGIGSIYMSFAGKQYVKVAQSSPPASTDWQRVTTTAAD